MNSLPPSSAKITNFKNTTILLVEDNPDHLALIETTLQECMPGIAAVGVVDRKAALGYLASEWKKNGRNIPKLILLDLYLPSREEGLLALEEFKTYFKSKGQPSIPIVVFSFSDSPEDIQECYASGANAYMVKSPDYHDWKEFFEDLRDFWLEIVSLPVHDV